MEPYRKIGHNLIPEATERLVNKWDRTGLLKGLTDEQREDLAYKLESLMVDMLGPGYPTGIDILREHNLTSFLLPLQRRVMEHQISLVRDEIRVNGRKFMTADELVDRKGRIHKDVTCLWTVDDEVELCKTVAEEMIRFASQKP